MPRSTRQWPSSRATLLEPVAPALATVAFAVLAAPPLGGALTASLPTHVLVQIPLLVLCGIVFGRARAGRRGGPADTAEAIAGTLLALGCLGFWMLPRWLDAAVTDPVIDLAKAGSLFLLAGVPLGWAWPGLPPVARALLWAQAMSMCGVLAWLHLSAPERLCTNYLLDEQAVLGRVLLVVAATLAGGGALFALRGPLARAG